MQDMMDIWFWKMATLRDPVMFCYTGCILKTRQSLTDKDDKDKTKGFVQTKFWSRRNIGTHSDMFVNPSWRDYETLPQLL